jgi:hypothetical protein
LQFHGVEYKNSFSPRKEGAWTRDA